MLLILLTISCLNSQPSSCNMSSMKAFDVSNEGVRAACNEYLTPIKNPKQKKALALMYAVGLNIKMSNASGACMATPEKLDPQEYRKEFFENVWNQQ